jgi:hypothetical protein
MTDINHRRKNKKPRNTKLVSNENVNEYNNGYGLYKNKDGIHEGTPGYLDKSMQCWGRKSEFSDKIIMAGIGNDFSNGNRGMARSVKGAKKFVRSRIRFHDKQKLNKVKYDESDEE